MGLKGHVPLSRVKVCSRGRQSAQQGEKDADFRRAKHTVRAAQMFARLKFASSLFWLGGALNDPVFGLWNLPGKFPQNGAEVLGVAIVSPHAGPQLGFVNELVRVGAVL